MSRLDKFGAFLLIQLCFVLNAWSQRPDFTGRGTSGVPSTSIDSIVSKKLVYKSTVLDSLFSWAQTMDSSIQHVHLIEPYYQNPFVASNLGSENSPFIEALWEDPYKVGLQDGFRQHLFGVANNKPQRLIDINRSLMDVYYGKGFAINSSNFALDFATKFNRGILLNAAYKRISDDSWLGNQPNSQRKMNFLLYQSDRRGLRKSYVNYDRTTMDITQSRGTVNGSTENASILTKSIHIDAGNQMILGDTVPNKDATIIGSRLSIEEFIYDFDDRSVSATERSYYRHTTSDDTLTLSNNMRTIALSNSISGKWKGFYGAVGLDLNFIRREQNVASENFAEVVLNFSARRKLSSQLYLDFDIQAGLFDAMGDVNVAPRITKEWNTGSSLLLSLLWSQASPELRYLNTFINSTRLWQPELSDVKRLGIKALYGIKPFSATFRLSYDRYTDWIVFNEDAVPLQLASSLDIVQGVVSAHWSWKSFQTHHNFFYQYLSSDRVLHQPFQYHGNYMLPIPIFQNKMDIVAGLDIYYVPSHTIPTYNPVLNAFYNDFSNNESGQIVIVNPFLNIKVDRFFGFVKVINATNRLHSQNRFFIKDYPLYDFRISAGIRWILLD